MPIDIPPAPKLWVPPKPAIIRPAPDIRVPSMLGITMLSRMSLVRAKRAAAAAGDGYSNLSYIGTTASGEGSGSVTGVSIGTAAANRVVIVGVVTTGAAVGTLTVNAGSPESSVVNAYANVSDTWGSAIFAVNIPTGTTADFEISGAVAFCSFIVWRVLMSSTVAHDTSSATQTTAVTSHPVTGVIMPANGFGIAVQVSSSSAGSTIDTGFVERVDNAASGYQEYGADLESVAGFGSSTVTITSGTGRASATCIATFNGNGT